MSGKSSTQRILNERAMTLSKKKRNDAARDMDHYILFHLGNQELFAIPYQFVKKVVPLTHHTPVPGAPDVFLGITYYNAQIWPIINTEILLGFDKVTPDQIGQHIIILQRGHHRQAMTAKYIVGHITVEKKSIQAFAPNEAQSRKACVLGIYQPDITILNAERLLSAIEDLALADEEPGKHHE